VRSPVGAGTALALLDQGSRILSAAGREDARQSAEWLLGAALGVGRFGIYLDPAREPTSAEARRYLDLVERRARGEPLQYLLGYEDFHGLRLAVAPDALIPRPETEGLVEWAVELVQAGAATMAADVGTGSGAIACALATRFTGLTVLAIDCSPAALAVAADNVRAQGLRDRVRLLAGDLVDPLVAEGVTVDLLVANLPYLPSATLGASPGNVAQWEPRVALDGGPDGLVAIRRLVTTAPGVLAPGAALLMEIGDDQAGPIASLMAAEGFVKIQSRRDLNRVERYVCGRWGCRPAGSI
jgi:release factor glutamine methyltransferase